MRVLSIGEVLWDVFPDKERLGGAPLNFCAHLSRFGDEAVVLSAVGDDERGRVALDRMEQLGLSRQGVTISQRIPTGTALIRIEADGTHSFSIPRPAAFDEVMVSDDVLEQAHAGSFDWLYFGTLLQTSGPAERLTGSLIASSDALRCFYDMNLRDGHWTLDLVQRLAGHASIMKTNEAEAETLHKLIHGYKDRFSLASFCEEWAHRYSIDTICITRGADGCVIYDGTKMTLVPGCRIVVNDTVGAGDAFSAAFLHAYHHNWPLERAARFANGLGAIVASRAGAIPDWSTQEIEGMFDC